ncbi:hypothetical protein [Prescottella equi]|uniref:hypothetical protein n=1 Tax=Rhodococcus hoagii TaxID=43767 RepID=UPI001EEAAEC3|nr:hypothetical protein [Prescottella equi]
MKQSGKVFYGVLNQAVLSLGTFLTLIFAARGYPSDVLGVFTMGAVTYQMLTVISRALAGEPLIVLPAKNEADVRVECTRCLQFSGTIAIPIGIVGVIGVVLADSVVKAVCASLVILPGLMVQDALRHVLLRRSQFGTALVYDALVVSIQVAVVAVGASQGFEPWLLILLLGLPAFIVGYARSYYERAGISISGAVAWRKQSRSLGNGFVFEATLGAVVQWVTLLAVAHFTSLSEAAAFRAIISIYGLTNIVTNYLRSHYLAQLARRGIESGKAVRRSVIEMGSMTMVTVGVTFVGLLLLPAGIGEKLLGDTWALAVPFLGLGALDRLCAGLTTIPSVILRVLRAPWRAAGSRVAVGVLTVVCAPVAVSMGGAGAGFIALSVMSVILTLLLSAICMAVWRARVLEPSSIAEPEGFTRSHL